MSKRKFDETTDNEFKIDDLKTITSFVKLFAKDKLCSDERSVIDISEESFDMDAFMFSKTAYLKCRVPRDMFTVYGKPTCFEISPTSFIKQSSRLGSHPSRILVCEDKLLMSTTSSKRISGGLNFMMHDMDDDRKNYFKMFEDSTYADISCSEFDGMIDSMKLVDAELVQFKVADGKLILTACYPDGHSGTGVIDSTYEIEGDFSMFDDVTSCISLNLLSVPHKLAGNIKLCIQDCALQFVWEGNRGEKMYYAASCQVE